jgi:sigma-70-like protein
MTTMPMPAAGAPASNDGPGSEFQAIYDEFKSRILRYLTRLVGSGDAEDVTQEVFVKVSQGRRPDRRVDLPDRDELGLRPVEGARTGARPPTAVRRPGSGGRDAAGVRP